MITLTGDLCEQLAPEAQAENKTVDEIVSDALGMYLGLRQLERLRVYGRKQAAKLGLTEADIPRLIAESRRQSCDL